MYIYLCIMYRPLLACKCHFIAVLFFYVIIMLVTQHRVVTKISSCRVNTTSRQGIKQLGISFGSIFLLFSNKSSRGPLSQQQGKIPGPRLLMTTLLALSYYNLTFFFPLEFWTRKHSQSSDVPSCAKCVQHPHAVVSRVERRAWKKR